MTRRLPFVIVLAAVASTAAAAPATPIQPGYWETTNRVLSPLPSKKVERRCISPADVDKFLSGPSNRHYTCTYPTRRIADGKILLKGTCVSKKGQKVAISGSGTYTYTAFTVTAQIQTDIGGIPIGGRAVSEARRIGDECPPEPPKKNKKPQAD
jgi:hypothetical protein